VIPLLPLDLDGEATTLEQARLIHKLLDMPSDAKPTDIAADVADLLDTLDDPALSHFAARLRDAKHDGARVEALIGEFDRIASVYRSRADVKRPPPVQRTPTRA
jgi:hypothetical protein